MSAAPARRPRPAPPLPAPGPRTESRTGIRTRRGRARVAARASHARPRAEQQVTAGRGPLAGRRAGRGWCRPCPPPRGRRARPDPGSSPRRSGHGRAAGLLLLRARLGPAPAPPGARPWAGQEGPRGARAALTHRRGSPPPGLAAHWAPRGRMSPGGTSRGRTSGRRRGRTRLPPAGPGQCPCSRASRAASRDRQFSASAFPNSE